MADSRNLENRIAIRVQTDGQDKVVELGVGLEHVGEAGSGAAPKLKPLADALRNLGREQVDLGATAQGVRSVGDALDGVKTAGDGAAAAVREDLDQVGAAADEAVNRLKPLAEDLRDIGTQPGMANAAQGARVLEQAAAGAAADVGKLAEEVGQTTQVTRTWRDFVAERMGPLMRQFAAEGLSHAEAHTKAIRQVAAEWKQYKATGEAAAKGVATAAAATEPAMKGVAAAVREIGSETQTSFTKTAQGVRSISEQLDRARTQLLGFFGLHVGADLLKDLGDTADLYKNIAARLDLVNSGQAGFNVTLEQTAQLARETHSGLEGTTNLLAALARAGAELGASQGEVLRLTETINKANQVSGQSAAAAEAAVTQLIQGLQSGTLRGEEFNSVMEQAPRLAKALADGLGVPLGALRQMANEGKLTSAAVIEALQSQAQAIDAEFATLPLTIDRAVTDLQTKWTEFVGNLDASTGASETAAQGLELVANHLDDIAGAAEIAGEIVVAALAVRAAAALRTYIAQTVVSTGATTAHAAALTGLAAAGRAATGALVTLGRALPVLAVAGVVTGVAALVTEFFRAKSAAEESEAAVRKMLEEAPQNNAAKEIELVATKAEAARFQLTEMERAYRDLRAKGQDAAAALDGVVKAANLTSLDGVAALVKGVDELRVGAQVTGEQIQTSLVARLSRLNTNELREFGIMAEMAFKLGDISAKQLAVTLDAQARVALQRLGVDADTALTGISAKFREAEGAVAVVAGQYDRLKASGAEAGAVLQQAIDGAIKAATNRAELDMLTETVKRFGAEGKLAGAAVAAELGKIRTKADQITPGINSVAEAFKALGIASQAELKATADNFRSAYETIRNSGQATASQLQQAFVKYAQAAIAANGGVASDTLKIEAAMRGVTIETDAAGRAIVQAMKDGQAATDAFAQSAAQAAGKVAMITREANFLHDAEGNLLDPAKQADAASSSTGLYGARGGDSINAYTERGAYGLAKQQGLTEEQALKVAADYIAHQNDAGALGKLNRAIDDLVLANARAAAAAERAAKSSDAGRETSAQRSAPAASPLRVDIAYRDRVTPINVASAGDATALQSLLKQLEADMSRAA